MSTTRSVDLIGFRIRDSKDRNGQRVHGHWWTDESGNRWRYLSLDNAGGHITGYVTGEIFANVMRALVSADYDTPNWCERCHIAGHSYCRCEIACNE